MLKIIASCLLFIILISCKAFSAPSPLEPHADPVIVDDVAFHKLGTYRGFTDEGAEYQKSFFVSRNSAAPWAESKAICKAFDLELATMETLTEARSLFTMGENHSFLRTLSYTWLWVDSIGLTGKSTTDWYWTKSGRKIAFPIPWFPGSPDTATQLCMVIGRGAINQKFGFNDGTCSDSFRFVCQRVDFVIP